MLESLSEFNYDKFEITVPRFQLSFTGLGNTTSMWPAPLSEVVWAVGVRMAVAYIQITPA